MKLVFNLKKDFLRRAVERAQTSSTKLSPDIVAGVKDASDKVPPPLARTQC